MIMTDCAYCVLDSFKFHFKKYVRARVVLNPFFSSSLQYHSLWDCVCVCVCVPWEYASWIWLHDAYIYILYIYTVLGQNPERNYPEYQNPGAFIRSTKIRKIQKSGKENPDDERPEGGNSETRIRKRQSPKKIKFAYTKIGKEPTWSWYV